MNGIIKLELVLDREYAW